MFSQAKSKRGVSVIIGYVLLVTFAVIIGLIVFQWMKSYVPQDDLNCPDGVSMFIKSYVCSSNMLTITIKNNGKFDIGGYFIHATDSPEEELATIDISKNNTHSLSILRSGIKFGNILISGNPLEPDDEELEEYNITGINIYSIEIIPIRWQKEKNRNVLVSCKDAKLREIIRCDIEVGTCQIESVEETCNRVGSECGQEINLCFEEVYCGNCTLLYGPTYVCDSIGQCIPAIECTDTCSSLAWECGIVCGNACGACPALPNSQPVCVDGECTILSTSCDEGWLNCNGIEADGCETQLGTNSNCASCGDVCATGSNCVGGICTSCNGTWTSDETSDVECDGTPSPLHCTTCVCDTGYDPNTVGGCWPSGTSPSCQAYCSSLGYLGIPPGTCINTANRCSGVYESKGNIWCTTNPFNFCCCKP